MQRKIKLKKCTSNGNIITQMVVFTDSIESYEQGEKCSIIFTKSGREFYVREHIEDITKLINIIS